MIGGFCVSARTCTLPPPTHDEPGQAGPAPSATQTAAPDNELTGRFFPFTREQQRDAGEAAHLLNHLTCNTQWLFVTHVSL